MNREILFKAKRIDNGEWVEGYYVKTTIGNDGAPSDVIFVPFKVSRNEKWGWVKVDPDTLCQYIGVTDKNGKKIWENDILRGCQYPYLSDGNCNYYAEVIWFENCHAFGIYTFKNPKSNVRGISEGNTELMEDWISEDWEVIGNIFDNAELLEG